MVTIHLDIDSLAEFRNYYIRGDNLDELFVPLSLLENPVEISSGDSIDVQMKIIDINAKYNINGIITWKRIRDIKMPRKIIHAGIGIKIDETSLIKIAPLFTETAAKLEDMDSHMVGGNYIRVRSDIADKYRSKTRKTEKSYKEKRSQPRVSITMPLEAFVDNRVFHFKSNDISLYGMAIETDEDIPIDEEIVIIIEDQVYQKQTMLKSVVKRHIYDKSSEEQKRIGVGIQFIFESDNQKRELMQLIVRMS